MDFEDLNLDIFDLDIEPDESELEEVKLEDWDEEN